MSSLHSKVVRLEGSTDSLTCFIAQGSLHSKVVRLEFYHDHLDDMVNFQRFAFQSGSIRSQLGTR